MAIVSEPSETHILPKVPGATGARDSEGEAGKSPPSFRLQTLKQRREFQAANGGRRYSTTAFTVLRGKGAAGDSVEAVGVRFGFTVTRKVGTATERNRIRRRLREAVRAAADAFPPADAALVVLARRAAIDRAFPELVEDMRKAVLALLKEKPAKPEKHTKSED